VLKSLEDKEALKQEEKLLSIYDEDIDAIKSPALRTKKIYGAFNRIYFYECAKGLKELSDKYGIEIIYMEGYESAEDFLSPDKLPKYDDIKVGFAVSEGIEPGDKNLDIIVGVVAPEITVDFIKDGVWFTDFEVTINSDSDRFIIHSWKLRQNPIDDEIEMPKFG
jgi:hypothetical protein